MAISEIESKIPTRGVRVDNAYHLALVWTPNILNPHKLLANVTNPVGEVLHTRHNQYPVEIIRGQEYHVVEHMLLNKLTTVDIIRESVFASGFLPRIKQLMGRDFYYGHDKYFPEPFQLVDRTFIGSGFHMGRHLEKLFESLKMGQ